MEQLPVPDRHCAEPGSRALKYALRAVELSDDPNIWDTLIEAYLANGRKADALRVCKDALVTHPNEQVLKDRLVQLGKTGRP